MTSLNRTWIGRGIALFFLGLFCLPTSGASAPAFPICDGDKVVFYGDNITDGEWYPTMVETYVVTRYPAWRNQFFNRGQGGGKAVFVPSEVG